MSTENKLRKLIQTKDEIRSAIISKGVELSPETKFSNYANKILEIEQSNIPNGDSILITEYFLDTPYPLSVEIYSSSGHMPSHFISQNSSTLTNVVINDGLRILGPYGLVDLPSLSNIITPKTLETIETNGIVGLDSLISLNIPNVKRVNYYGIYRNYSLSELTLGSPGFPVEFIDSGALDFCDNLSEIVIYVSEPNNPPSDISNNAPWGAYNANITYRQA